MLLNECEYKKRTKFCAWLLPWGKPTRKKKREGGRESPESSTSMKEKRKAKKIKKKGKNTKVVDKFQEPLTRFLITSLSFFKVLKIIFISFDLTL